MKRIVTVLLLLLPILGLTSLQAQTLKVNRSDYSQVSFTFAVPDLTQTVREVEGNPYCVLSFPSASPSTTIGKPDLPILSEMVEVPLCENVRVSITDVQTKQLDNLKYRLMPVQPVPSKRDREPLPFVLDSAAYAVNDYFELPAVQYEPMGIARDRNLGILRMSPLRYNPVTGEAVLITSMTVTLTFEQADVAATELLHTRYHSPDFGLGHTVANALPATKEVRRAAPLHYLIVAHSSFRGQLDDFIQWKRKKGFLVTALYTGDAGVGTTSSAIANCIKQYYTGATDSLPAPTYLLLVGDHEQIPAFAAQCGSPSTDHISDLYFALWTDGDHIPDCYYGRFSARTVAELTPQIEKTLYYEQYAFADDSYLGRGVLIAGQDYGYNGDNAYNYADPSMDYAANYYINAANGYNSVYYYKNNTSFAPTGVTVTGSSQTSSTAASLRTLYNTGCGWVNYSAHGYDNEWSTPSFTTSHVDNMTNTNMPSFMIGNCCLSGKFNTTSYDACLGEALLRKGGNAGAVAYIGGTNSTYWPQDFCWSVGVRSNISGTMNASYSASYMGMYDRLFHTHNENFSAWHNTAGAMVTAGNSAVEQYGNYSYYYWEIYELFGDPSLMPWLGTAQEMTVEASNVVSVGVAEYTVQAAPYAYVALTTDEEHDFICAAYADANGSATLELPTDLSPNTYELAIWAQGYKPYFQPVQVLVLDGPYVMAIDLSVADGTLKPGKVNALSVDLTNVGSEYPSVGLLTLSSATEGVVVSRPEMHFEALAPGDTMRLEGLWSVYIPSTMVDGQQVQFTVQVNFGDQSIKRRTMTVCSPRLVVSNPWVAPQLMPADTSTITCRLTNNGHDTTADITLVLRNQYNMVQWQPSSVHVGRMTPGQAVDLTFQVAMRQDVPTTTIPFHLYAEADGNSQLVDVLTFSAGVSDMEDFETGTLSRFEWVQGSNPWEITTSPVYAGSYCARSKTNLSGRRESRMTLRWESTVDDSIRFYYRVSSEENYDLFRFYIDGNEQMSASGDVDWIRAAFAVAAGSHTYAFSYTKDWMTNSGSDCAWVDNLQLPFSGDVCHFTFDSVCQGAEYSFADQAVSTDQCGTYNLVDTIGETTYLCLSVLEPPVVTIDTLRTPTDQCYLLRAKGADHYTWSTGDSTDCIAVCPDQTTTYSVEGCRAGCCTTTSFTLLGVDASATAPHLSVYPNPATYQVTIVSDYIQTVEIINLMGQSLGRKSVNASATTLDIQKLPKGVYFLQVKTPEAVQVRKIVKR